MRAMSARLKDQATPGEERKEKKLGLPSSPETKRRTQCWAPSRNAPKPEHRNHSESQMKRRGSAVLEQTSSSASGANQCGTLNLSVPAVCRFDLIKYYFLNNIFNES